jgi:hypothetical protein
MDEQKLRKYAGLERLDEAPTGRALKKLIIVRDANPGEKKNNIIDGPDNLWWEVTERELRLQLVGAISARGGRDFIQEEWTFYPANAKADAIKDATERFNKLDSLKAIGRFADADRKG